MSFHEIGQYIRSFDSSIFENPLQYLYIDKEF